MRWSTSGRFTPLRGAFTTISFGFGAGFGNSATRRTSGPPGWLISTARMVMAIIPRRGGVPMAQFRAEFVLEEGSGKDLVGVENPDNQQEIMVRTEALYESQAAAVLGLVQ